MQLTGLAETWNGEMGVSHWSLLLWLVAAVTTAGKVEYGD